VRPIYSGGWEEKVKTGDVVLIEEKQAGVPVPLKLRLRGGVDVLGG
jgi:hypothetical protein